MKDDLASVLTDERFCELIEVAEKGYVATAIRQAVREAIEAQAVRIAELEREKEAGWCIPEQYGNAVARGDYESVARMLSGRLRQMDKRAKAANTRADTLASALAEAVTLLTDVRHNGLIYWEPQSQKGAEQKALMSARLDAFLAKHKGETDVRAV